MMKAEILPESFFKRLILMHKLKTGKSTSGLVYKHNKLAKEKGENLCDGWWQMRIMRKLILLQAVVQSKHVAAAQPLMDAPRD